MSPTRDATRRSRRLVGIALPLAALLLTGCGSGLEETPPPRPVDVPEDATPPSDGTAQLVRQAARATYRLYVANESSDDVNRIAFTPGQGIEVENTIAVGVMPGDIDGAHGITVSPDGSRWYLTLAHGTPFGSVWQFATGADTLIARTELGRFPATMGITPDGSMLFVVNFNLHGDREPSDVSVVYTPEMTELTRIPACITPHGGRVSEDGTKHYFGCTGSDQVVEVDTRTMEVTKRFSVAPGAERSLALTNRGEDRQVDTTVVDRIEVRPEMQQRCSPTWAEPATGTRANRILYVSCNADGGILVLSTDTWQVEDRYSTGSTPYNMEVTPDGRYLVATLRSEGAVAIHDLDQNGTEVARIETSEPLAHGVVASPDSRYVFISNESRGSTRGSVDVVDLASLQRVASVSLGHQTGGIGFWEIERVGR